MTNKINKNNLKIHSYHGEMYTCQTGNYPKMVVVYLFWGYIWGNLNLLCLRVFTWLMVLKIYGFMVIQVSFIKFRMKVGTIVNNNSKHLQIHIFTFKSST